MCLLHVQYQSSWKLWYSDESDQFKLNIWRTLFLFILFKCHSKQLLKQFIYWLKWINFGIFKFWKRFINYVVKYCYWISWNYLENIQNFITKSIQRTRSQKSNSMKKNRQYINYSSTFVFNMFPHLKGPQSSVGCLSFQKCSVWGCKKVVSLDHDFHVSGIIPSVYFNIRHKKNAKDSFYNGLLYVTGKDKMFEVSSPRHSPENVS